MKRALTSHFLPTHNLPNSNIKGFIDPASLSVGQDRWLIYFTALLRSPKGVSKGAVFFAST